MPGADTNAVECCQCVAIPPGEDRLSIGKISLEHDEVGKVVAKDRHGTTALRSQRVP